MLRHRETRASWSMVTLSNRVLTLLWSAASARIGGKHVHKDMLTRPAFGGP